MMDFFPAPVKAGEHIRRIDGPLPQPGLERRVGLLIERDLPILLLILAAELDHIPALSDMQAAALDTADFRHARPIAEGVQEGQERERGVGNRHRRWW